MEIIRIMQELSRIVKKATRFLSTLYLSKMEYQLRLKKFF